jgi:hypothetical protein
MAEAIKLLPVPVLPVISRFSHLAIKEPSARRCKLFLSMPLSAV